MLKGKCALVTGSTSGIGLAVAHALAVEGCDVMIAGLAPEGVPEQLCADIRQSTGRNAIYSAADLSKPPEVRKMVADTIAGLGGIDILVNNAGLQFVSPITEFPDDKWEMLRSIMLDAHFHAIKAALPSMISKKWGRIINVSSANGIIAQPNKAAYVAAKHGVVGLTKEVALEVAQHGVTCNSICPGLVMTDLIRRQLPAQAKLHNCSEDEALQKVFLAGAAIKRGIEPEEIAQTAVFLCSQWARSITGAAIVVDGGYTIQ